MRSPETKVDLFTAFEALNKQVLCVLFVDGEEVQLAHLRPQGSPRTVALHQPQHAELRPVPQVFLRQRFR